MAETLWKEEEKKIRLKTSAHILMRANQIASLSQFSDVKNDFVGISRSELEFTDLLLFFFKQKSDKLI